MNRINQYINQLRNDDSSIRSNVNFISPYPESYSKRILEEQKILQYRRMRDEETSGDAGVRVEVYVDPLPDLSNEDAWIRMNGWCSNGNGVGGNSERVLRPNHPDFLSPEEVT